MLISELRRTFTGFWFWAAIGIGCGISICHIAQFVIPDYREALQFPSSFPPTVFSKWIGGWSYPIHPALFYFIMPILATLPYGWSLHTDMKNGHYIQKATRSGWPRYLAAKLVAVFLSGGTAVCTALIVDFLGTACVVPLVQPDPIGIGNFMVFPYSFAAELFR